MSWALLIGWSQGREELDIVSGPHVHHGPVSSGFVRVWSIGPAFVGPGAEV